MGTKKDFGLNTDVEDFTLEELADMLTSDRSYTVTSDEQDELIVKWAKHCIRKWITANVIN
jgi:hypothetical protein